MATPNMTTVVSDFYADVCRKCNFNTRVNEKDIPSDIWPLVGQLSEECMKRYYGAGFVFPENLEGARVLDLGCGSGSLVFLLSKLVGPSGYVVGVDVCEDLYNLALQESEYHYKKWGYDKANFEFKNGNIEKLTEIGLQEGSFDAIVSSGVFCLCPDQSKVFQQTFKMLKPGGQFILSDVFGNKPQPDSLKTDAKLWALGTTGSLVWSELSPLVSSLGFSNPQLLQVAGVDIKNQEIRDTLDNGQYVCAAWRMFKLPSGAQQKGAASVTYRGNIAHREEEFRWDMDTVFKKGQALVVDGELASILSNTPFKNNFDVKEFAGDAKPRNQNPFDHLDHLEKEGRLPTPAYDIE